MSRTSISPASPSEPTSVAIYCRLSQARDGSTVKVETQEEVCREWAATRGLSVGEVYVDNSISATSGAIRPAWERLLADRPDHVLMWNSDRLCRLVTDLERVIALGIYVHSVQGVDMDLSTPGGRMVARIVTSVAQHEGELRKERQLMAYRKRAQRGERGWVNRPFGYELDGTLRESEATLLREAFTAVLQGEATGTIANRWNAAGFVGHFGKPFTRHTVKQTMKNARNAGLKVYQGEIVGVGDWTPVVDEPTWRGAVAVLADPKRGRNGRGGNRITAMLTGIATCSVCGESLWIARTDTLKNALGDPVRVRKYGCPKGHLTVDQEWLDSVTLHVMREALPANMGAWTGPNDDAEMAARALVLRAELATVEDRMRELAEAFSADVLTMDQVRTATEELRKRRDMAQGELDGLKAGASATEWINDIEAFFSLAVDMDLGRLRAMVSGVFAEIVVSPMGKGRYSRPSKDKVKFTPRVPTAGGAWMKSTGMDGVGDH